MYPLTHLDFRDQSSPLLLHPFVVLNLELYIIQHHLCLCAQECVRATCGQESTLVCRQHRLNTCAHMSEYVARGHPRTLRMSSALVCLKRCISSKQQADTCWWCGVVWCGVEWCGVVYYTSAPHILLLSIVSSRLVWSRLVAWHIVAYHVACVASCRVVWPGMISHHTHTRVHTCTQAYSMPWTDICTQVCANFQTHR